MRKHPSTQNAIRPVALAGLIGALGLASPPATRAEELPAFGMMGLARDQSAVLSLVLVNPPDDRHPGCRLTASVVDAQGRVLQDARRRAIEQTFVLRPQVAVELAVRGQEVVGPQEVRKAIRPALASARRGGSSDCGCLVATLEIIDSTGRTSVADVSRPPIGGGNPPPPPTCTAAAGLASPVP